ncbi:MAG: hypothetical protein HQL82_08190 [Magnetococcales bacterium]|nr:hypothetical protein [Magnetococcales bacterium]
MTLARFVQIRLLRNAAFLAAVLLPLTACLAQSNAALLSLLEGRDWALREADFKALGNTTDQDLIALAEDTTQPNYLRFRAIQALRLFPTGRSADWLERILTASPDQALVRRALDSYGAAFASSRTAQMERMAGDLLAHPDAQVRIGAARLMRGLNTATSADRYQQHLRGVTDPWERAEAEK